MICLGYLVPHGTFRGENRATLWRCGIGVFGSNRFEIFLEQNWNNMHGVAICG
jgi:hypothetical protein